MAPSVLLCILLCGLQLAVADEDLPHPSPPANVNWVVENLVDPGESQVGDRVMELLLLVDH